MERALPTGRPGRILALALLVLLAVVAWVGVAAPLLDWRADRAERMEQRQALAGRMDRVAASLPALQRAAEAGGPQGPAATTLLTGATDAVAAATLQQTVQEMASRVGAPLSSTETVPAIQSGAYRQVALRVSLRAPWPALVRLLQLIEQGAPRMLVDDLQLHATRLAGGPAEQPMDAGFTIIAFRAAGP